MNCEERAISASSVVAAAFTLSVGACGLICTKQGEAETRIKDLESALVLFQRDCGTYPTTQQSLRALVENPGTCQHWSGYLEKNQIPPDPWGHSFAYFYPGTHGQELEIISAGPDGKLDTGDDIVSWSLDGSGAQR